MPKGIYKRRPFTKLHRKHIGIGHKGLIPWNKGKLNYRKGFKLNDDIKLKISLTLKDKKLSEETKRKMKGRKVWNKGLKTGPLSIMHRKKIKDKQIQNRQKCHFWKGGITTTNYDLKLLIRNLTEYKDWIQKVFQRDNYTCQECFRRSIELQSHHKKQFAFIFQEFLQQYSQFSPIEDKETLVRLAATYEPFWDVSNGLTLCMKCHNKTKGVKIRC